ncbi:uncharacterized protein LOC130737234 [Lotus japonicus]|uniref:uncharacterized protein LOC130737234 n=1 Tax=Lotus japonicus TaxID=34305 RepID=UPI00258AB681|nr:uncharacterized protein LOC130737234 [Lotus japonicus]
MASDGREMDDIESNFFKEVWCKSVPSKVAATGWKIGLQRMPIMENLIKRGLVIHSNNSGQCVFCRDQVETSSHLFFSCKIVYGLWMNCYNWMGIQGVLPKEDMLHFLQHAIPWKGKKVNGWWKTVWFATIWSIWLCRNAVIFNSGIIDIEELCSLIKWRAWTWLRARVPSFKVSHYEWDKDPIYCLTMGAAA